MPVGTRIPKGLVFFPRDASKTFKRRRITFVVIAALAGLSTIWPIYPLFAKVYPMIFNLPFSLGWLVILLGITMAGLIWLYRTEDH